MGLSKDLVTGTATETDTARPAALAKALAVGSAVEVNSALAASFLGAAPAWAWLMFRGGALRPSSVAVADGAGLHPATADVT